MAFTTIDPTTPAGTDKIKFGDDRIREFKSQTIANLQELSNYPATAAPALRTAVWTTATRPGRAELVDRVSGLNTDHGCEEYYDLASTSWKYHSGQGYWSVSTRPASPPVGVHGYNSDLAVIERWDGTAYRRISGDPAGKVDLFAKTSPPGGWLKCNGQTIGNASSGATSRANADMQDLFEILWTDWDNTLLPIQDSSGSATTRGSTAANDFAANKRLPLPEMRGEFIRVFDDGRGIDSGRTFGSKQSDDFKSHIHPLGFGDWTGTGNNTYPPSGNDSTPYDTGNLAIGATGGTETRPRNIALAAYIKY